MDRSKPTREELALPCAGGSIVEIIAWRHEHVEQIGEPEHAARRGVNVFEQESTARFDPREQVAEKPVAAGRRNVVKDIECVRAGNRPVRSPVAQIRSVK